MRLHRRLFCALGSLPFLLGSSTFPAWADEPEQRPALNFSESPRPEAALNRTGARRTNVVAAIERVKGAIVNIHSERNLPGNDLYALAPSQNRVNGMGTGIIIDSRGYIVTNQHVVDDVNLLRVRLADGTTQNAAVVARHPEMDLALLKIDVAVPLPIMPIGTATDLMVGETVIAIGNAYGYEHTVSVGVVSALKRDVTLNKDMAYKALIQTDASINPGNSGGPLVNVNGELVGVNVAIRAGAQGIGFAIPADHMVRSVAEMLKSRRRGQTSDGLFCRDRLDHAADGTTVRSVVVERSDGSAALAGLKTGDVVVQVGDVKVACTYDVERGLMDHKNGDSVPVLVRRNHQEQKLDLVLAGADRMVRPASAVDLVWSKLGIQLAPVAADQVTRLHRQLHGGLEIVNVQVDSVAAKAGLKKGDILVGLHQWETLTLENVTYVLTHPDLTTFNPLSFFILRGGQVRRGHLSAIN
jgi:serine protease Do